MALMAPSPAEDCEIGDRDLAGGEFDLAESAIQDIVQPARLLGIALETIATVLFVGHLQKMVHLTGHGAETAHLPHQPLQDRDLPAQIGRPELSCSLTEINQYRTRFENADRRALRAVGVDDRGNFAVR